MTFNVKNWAHVADSKFGSQKPKFEREVGYQIQNQIKNRKKKSTS